MQRHVRELLPLELKLLFVECFREEAQEAFFTSLPRGRPCRVHIDFNPKALLQPANWHVDKILLLLYMFASTLFQLNVRRCLEKRNGKGKLYSTLSLYSCTYPVRKSKMCSNGKKIILLSCVMIFLLKQHNNYLNYIHFYFFLKTYFIFIYIHLIAYVHTYNVSHTSYVLFMYMNMLAV